MSFDIAKEILTRIEFRRVGGKFLHPQAISPMADKLLNLGFAVRGQAVPHQQKLARESVQQVLQKSDHIGKADTSGQEFEVEVHQAHRGHDADPFIIPVALQNGSLAFGSPGADHIGFLAQARLVDKENNSPFLEGFFLI